MEPTTSFYHNGELVSTQPAMTIQQFREAKKMEPGQYIKVQGAQPFWVGDCTPFHEPSDNDAGFAWNWRYNTERLITEVQTFSV